MRILHFSGATHWGGGEYDLMELIEWLNKFDVSIAVYCTLRSPLAKKETEAGITCYPLYNKKANPISRAIRLAQLLREKKIDLIHIHTSDALTTYYIGYLFGWIKIPCVYAKNVLSKASTFLSRLKYNCEGIKSIVCISEAVKTSLSAHLYSSNKNKACVIHNGINLNKKPIKASFDIRTRLSLPSNAYVVGNIANHTPPKDLKTFLRTANYLINTLQEHAIYFVQIGEETKYTPSLKKIYSELHLEKIVFFLGFCPNASSLISQFNATLITSKEEGLNLTIIELYNSNIPVIATRAGGIPEAVFHKETGLLSDIGDYKTLAENILFLKQHPEETDKMVKNARIFFPEEYDTEKIYDLYQRILSTSHKINILYENICRHQYV